MERRLIQLPQGEAGWESGTPEELAAMQGKLAQLLERQIWRYTMEESSSVRVETAQELLTSLMYCLGMALEGQKDQREQLLHGDYPALIQSGLAAIERETRAGLERYQYLCDHPPAVTNRAYRETVGNILAFFRRYNPQFFAHTVDCSIDYQLFLPVSERLQGISYLNTYLSHLMLENSLLYRFQRPQLLGCIQSACPDYEDLLVNLYEPVLQNAIGLALLDRDVTGLSVSQEERDLLQSKLEPLSVQERRAALERAADRLWEVLEFRDPVEREYLRRSAETLLPRLDVALTHHTLEGLFVTF